MPKLMSQHSNDLFLVHLFNEGVKENHPLVLEESIEIGLWEITKASESVSCFSSSSLIFLLLFTI